MSDGEGMDFSCCYDNARRRPLKLVNDLLQPEFAANIMQYMWSLWQLQLDDEEMGAFTGLLLASPVRAGLNEPASVAAMHRALGDALRFAVTQRVRNPVVAEIRLDNLVGLAGKARSLGACHQQALTWCRTNWMHLTLPALFIEIFDIPKSEEEALEAEAAAITGPPLIENYDPAL